MTSCQERTGDQYEDGADVDEDGYYNEPDCAGDDEDDGNHERIMHMTVTVVAITIMIMMMLVTLVMIGPMAKRTVLMIMMMRKRIR